jgi:hypothetical protein
VRGLVGKGYRLCLTLGALPEPEHAFGESDAFRITAGCDKQSGTCHEIRQHAELHGFPHVPDNDFMLKVASRTDKNDGRRLR